MAKVPYRVRIPGSRCRKAFDELTWEKLSGWRVTSKKEATAMKSGLGEPISTMYRSQGPVTLPNMKMDPEDFKDICNKSVPVYILSNVLNDPLLIRLVAIVLHNYIYRRWFRPYRSELSHSRFISHLREGTRHPSGYTECAADYQRDGSSSTWELHKHYVVDHHFYILQPLFGTLLITACCEEDKNKDSKSVGCLPIYLIRTGVEGGLSAPITFASIAEKIEKHLGDSGNAVKTTLETAIDFVMGLEAEKQPPLVFNQIPPS
ncbi:hypothetical protein B0T25DRAFT_631027 [Lasiosphaeria hispida]|uniref:Uncharacterized protein n=1 Tax=Lasiosphaeria hispida TaxID=260671 RepID=A0AAJ0HNX7_9PEZI|nr:hypothetical protein B0T25DRAFT_631027 [Lasiosphaeria hispida]